MLPILACLFIFVIWIAYQRSKSDKAVKNETAAFWNRERESNLTRKKDLSTLNYITVMIENLPFSETEDEEIQYVQKQLNNLKDQKIVNLSGLSNTDLKIAYGAPNITLLSTYDHNFTLLIRHLNKWGHLLYQNNNITDAKIVFEYAISCGSDISQTYLALAAIYLDDGSNEKLVQLRDTALTLTTPLKETLLFKLNAICEKASHELK
jgi:tetratricopeptide (TPR) repeat protein